MSDETKKSEFKKELENLINKHSKENGSNTPDFLLAEYLNDCLAIYDNVVTKRDKWRGEGLTDEDFCHTCKSVLLNSPDGFCSDKCRDEYE